MKCYILVFLLLLPGLAQAGDTNPVADPDAIVISGDARFTILTEKVIRMEWAEGAAFEDHASLVFVNRNLPVPEFKESAEAGWLSIETAQLSLRYKVGSGKFNGENLHIEFTMDGQPKQWQPGLESTGNLKGTARTLDRFDGSANHYTGEEIDLGEGLISRDGWALIDDTSRPTFDNSDWPWVQARPERAHQDLYFFGYGYDYQGALADYTEIAGKIALPPRYVFGSWWSRYWEYTDWELRELIREFEIHDVPLDVLVVDMDWHITTKPEWYEGGKKIKDQAGEGAGWTGFTWNRNYFPDPEAFIGWTDEQGLRVCMNLHPASGIQPHEEQYPAMARAMGIDPKTKQYVPFDIVSRDFAENFLEIVLRPMENYGVDFWWLDWQQWSTTSIEGVNPIFYLNHVFFSDMERRNDKRPMIFHRYGGLGNHRYQIGFSGDSFINWQSLDFQPYFTATAANVCYGFWSHDIGGHMHGESYPELYTRWVQFGAFSPILRTHCTKAGYVGGIERRIWAYPYENFTAMREAFQLRYSLIPYIYTMAREAHDTGISLCRPMYYSYPKAEDAYTFGNQYMFGNDLLVAPITDPMDGDSLFVMQDVWLPEGEWFEWSTGSIVTGGCVVTRPFCLDEIPVYAKAGAVIPMQPKMKRTDEKPIDPLILNLFPGEAGATRVYEDESDTNDYKTGSFASTPVEFTSQKQKTTVVIGPVEGRYPGMPVTRGYELRLILTYPPEMVLIDGVPAIYGGGVDGNSWAYDGDELTTKVFISTHSVHDQIEVQINFPDLDRNALSGKKGNLRRLRSFMKFLAKNNWDKSIYSNDAVVHAAQTGYRIGLDPSLAEEEIQRFEVDWRDVSQMVNRLSKERAEYVPYRELIGVCEPPATD
jgi:alpha-glucosidase (family GH31 glycosyl hydrolase)